MRLKVWTTVSLATGLILLMMWPWLLGPYPPKQSTRELRSYSVRFVAFVALDLLAFAGAGIGAALLTRRAREEYRELSRENFEALIESTRQDHQAKQDTSE
jgi:hypothetical protein